MGALPDHQGWVMLRATASPGHPYLRKLNTGCKQLISLSRHENDHIQRGLQSYTGAESSLLAESLVPQSRDKLTLWLSQLQIYKSKSRGNAWLMPLGIPWVDLLHSCHSKHIVRDFKWSGPCCWWRKDQASRGQSLRWLQLWQCRARKLHIYPPVHSHCCMFGTKGQSGEGVSIYWASTMCHGTGDWSALHSW